MWVRSSSIEKKNIFIKESKIKRKRGYPILRISLLVFFLLACYLPQFNLYFETPAPIIWNWGQDFCSTNEKKTLSFFNFHSLPCKSKIPLYHSSLNLTQQGLSLIQSECNSFSIRIDLWNHKKAFPLNHLSCQKHFRKVFVRSLPIFNPFLLKMIAG